MPQKKTAPAPSRSDKLTKEEERLLLESSRHVTKTASALFYGNAFIVSTLPLCKPSNLGPSPSCFCTRGVCRQCMPTIDHTICSSRLVLSCVALYTDSLPPCPGLFWRVVMMDLMTYGVIFAALTIGSTWLLQSAYKRTKIHLKHKLAPSLFSLHLSLPPPHSLPQDIHET